MHPDNTWDVGYEELLSTLNLPSLSNRRLFLNYAWYLKSFTTCVTLLQVFFLPENLDCTLTGHSCSPSHLLGQILICTHSFQIQFLTGIVYLYLWLVNVLFVNLNVVYTIICIRFILLLCCNLIGYTTD